MRLGIGGCRGTEPVGAGRDLDGKLHNLEEFGGSTTSLLVEAGDYEGGDGIYVVQDLGTGFRWIVHHLADERGFVNKYNPGNPGGRAKILLGHTHLDHVLGFGTTSLLYEVRNDMSLIGPRLNSDASGIRGAFDDLVKGRSGYEFFPVPVDWLESLTFGNFSPGDDLDLGYRGAGSESCFDVQTLLLNHPTVGSVAFRMTDRTGRRNRVIVNASDFEPDMGEFDERLVGFIRGADLVYIDSQYEERDISGARHNNYEGKEGWGHSTARMDIDLAVRAGFARSGGKIVLGHHDPESEDEYLRGYEGRAKAYAGERGINPDQVEFARQGHWYEVVA
jgi:ribonuclease BN (tRNA processing enzyme)